MDAATGRDLLVRGIGRLVPVAAPPVARAALLVRGGRVAWAGPERELPVGSVPAGVAELDASGACVVPGFVDAHTHLVFAGSRREEFLARLAGRRYDGGGIGVTVAATRAAGDEELLAAAAGRARAALAHGTTTLEIKSGYGLTPDDELRLLDLAGRLPERVPVHVERTYLGAHVVPAGRDRAGYLAEVIATLPAAAAHGARWADVFCDEGAFTVAEARSVLEAARAAGLGLRLHAEQLGDSGGALLAADLGCASADHLDHVSAPAARALAAAGVVGVVLPAATLTLGGGWGHGRVLAEAGVELAIATDTNPGTSWCESMPYVLQLACLAMGLSVEQALRAATVGGAHALRMPDAGYLAPGARGDLAVLEAEH